MDLVNTTPLPARLTIVKGPEEGQRRVSIVAKATFRVDEGSVPVLDVQEPLPFLDVDRETELGVLPADTRARSAPGFEVMVLGKAHSATGAPVTRMSVRLQVDRIARRLVVSGDRIWIGRGAGARIGPAHPFTEMTLDWSRAFGGSVEIEIDEGAFLDVADPRNTLGKGFDHLERAEGMDAVFRCPEGYPSFLKGRPLPNLEDPDDRVQSWEDAPLPVCWAPAPVDSGILVERVERRFGAEGTARLDTEALIEEPLVNERAHPDWVIDTPPERAPVILDGMRPGGERFAFRLPRARVRLEVAAGANRHEAEAHPRALILLPEERRFCLIFAGATDFAYREDETRIARLVAERGWVPDTGVRAPAGVTA